MHHYWRGYIELKLLQHHCGTELDKCRVETFVVVIQIKIILTRT